VDPPIAFGKQARQKSLAGSVVSATHFFPIFSRRLIAQQKQRDGGHSAGGSVKDAM